MAKDAKGHGSDGKSQARGPGRIDYDNPSKPGKSGNTGRSSHFHASPGRDERLAQIAKNKADREQQATYKAGRTAQAAENRKIMGPTTGKEAQNMRDLVRAKIADGKAAAASKKDSDYGGSKVRSTTKNEKY